MAVSKHGVTIHLDTKRKLVFRQRELRDVVTATKRPIGELFDDPFSGWPHLLQYGLRLQDPRITLDKASDFMDLWVDTPDPDTQEPRTLDQLRELLLEALDGSNFVKITKFVPDEQKKLDDPTGAEGNG